MMERETTSIKVDHRLWKEFMKYAMDHDRDLSGLLEDIIGEKIR